MSPEQTVERMLTYWVPRVQQTEQNVGGDMHPEVLISGRSKGDSQHALTDSYERIHPSVLQQHESSDLTRMGEVLRSAMFAIASGYNVSVTWEQKE